MTELEAKGLSRGLTNYGDPDFAIYLRKLFAKSMGYSAAMLERPVVGIAFTPSGFNNCHRHFPELLEAVKRDETVGALSQTLMPRAEGSYPFRVAMEAVTGY